MSSEDYGENGEYSVDDETQLQPEDTLDGEFGHDVLDDGYEPPDRPRAAQSFGMTAAEQQRGESLDQRLAQEEPDDTYDPDNTYPEDAEAAGGTAPEARTDTSAGGNRRRQAPEEAALRVLDEVPGQATDRTD